MTLDWLVARPIAHRGLHEAGAGVIENSPSAFTAAIAGGYAIECDIQPSADGEAMVFHDFTLERLSAATGDVAARSARDLGAMTLKGSADRILTLPALFDLVAGRTPLVVEIKSRFDGDLTLTRRAAALCAAYSGPVALMSFDPAPLAFLKAKAPHLVRGFVGETTYDGAYWEKLSANARGRLRGFADYAAMDPHFLSWKVADLPHPATAIYRAALRRPVISWTVRTEEDRARSAAHADQVTFEGYRP